MRMHIKKNIILLEKYRYLPVIQLKSIILEKYRYLPVIQLKSIILDMLFRAMRIRIWNPYFEDIILQP